MERTFLRAAPLAVACLSAPALGGESTAAYVPCDGHDWVAAFSGTVTYSYTGGGTASVSVQLTNTTAPGLGGYITGLALGGGSGVTGMSFVSCTMASFGGLAGPVSAPPYGTFLGGASTGSSWLAGGNPAVGIGVGGSATFVFSLTGAAGDLAALSAEDVFGMDTGAWPYQMAVRFRGGSPDDWSDKVLGCAMPAPGALALLGAVGLISPRRRR